MNWLIDIVQMIAIGAIGWYAFRYVKLSKYTLYYVRDDNKVFGVTHSGNAELIHVSDGKIEHIAANRSVHQPQPEV